MVSVMVVVIASVMNRAINTLEYFLSTSRALSPSVSLS
jgi:hypothetical protein